MGMVNYYNGKNAAGTTLTDLKGSNNGTLAGASLPTINSNGYLSFTGGHGTTGGNYNRVVFTATSFQYSTASNFTFMIIFRSSKSDALQHSLFSIDDAGVNNYSRIWIEASEEIYHRIRTASGAYRTLGTSPSQTITGLWQICFVGYDSIRTNGFIYNDKYNILNIVETAGTLSGNFYSANAEAVLGGEFDAANDYHMDLTGDIQLFANFNHGLSAGEISSYRTYFKGGMSS